MNIPSQQTTNLTDLPQAPLEQETINKLITGLQEASYTGVTKLSSRDIPQTTEHIIKDIETKPNYIPEPQKVNYINKEEDLVKETVNKYNNNRKINDTVNDLYTEFNLPILAGILFFTLQMPIVNMYFKKFFPFLFSIDGNINNIGYVVKSILFSVIYYFFSKFINT
jgi:hypothetical protein